MAAKKKTSKRTKRTTTKKRSRRSTKKRTSSKRSTTSRTRRTSEERLVEDVVTGIARIVLDRVAKKKP
jgi:hypothetical protein